MKQLLFTIACLLSWTALSACDVCGGSVSGSSFGLLLQRPYHYVGLRVQYTSFKVIDEYQNNQQLQDRYWQYDVNGRFYFHKRLQVLASIPYQYNYRQGGESPLVVDGLGDIQLQLMSRLIEQDGEIHSHYLDLLLGLQLPTGTSATSAEELILPQGLYPGNGSFSYSIQLAYTYKYQEFGARLLGSLLIPTYNPDNYRYGQQAGANLTFFYEYQKEKWGLVPQLGLWSEWIAVDEKYRDGTEVYGTGGYGLLFDLGLDWQFEQFLLSVKGQIPLNGSYAEDLALPGFRSQLQAAYLF